MSKDSITKQDAFDEGWDLHEQYEQLKNEYKRVKRALVDVELENHKLREKLKWTLEQLREMDHDCHASPDDGCAWCFDFWEAGALVGMHQPDPTWEPTEPEFNDER